MKLRNQFSIQAALLVMAIAAGEGAAAQTVEWFFTDSLHPWVDKGDFQTVSTVPSGTATVNIYPDSLLQPILGFGGCFNEKGWDALSVLSSAGRDSVMKALFDTSGCAFNYCRMPIGSSDFGLSVYSLDDTSGDFALNHFSISRDMTTMIPYIKAAQTFSPSLQVWGVPWAIPGWMMASAVFCTPQMFTSLALYFEKYVQSYQQQGVNVVAVHAGNEPCGGGGGVNTVYSAQQMHDFIRYYLGPKFTQDNINAQIWQGDLNCTYDAYVAPIFDDTAAAKYVTGAGLQYAGEADIGKVGQYHPDKKVLESESNCFNGGNSWSDGYATAYAMYTDLGHGANAYMQWNMVLDQTGASLSNWVQDALVTVNKTTKAVTYNPELYCVKHFTHFVERGARLCKVSGAPWTNTALAFVNPNGDIVIVDRCQGTGAIAFKAGAQAAVVNYTDGLHTFVLKSGSSAVQTTTTAGRPGLSATGGGRAFEIVGDRIVVPRAVRAAVQAVDLYDVKGRLLKRASVGPDGVAGAGSGLIGRQAVIVRVSQTDLRRY